MMGLSRLISAAVLASSVDEIGKGQRRRFNRFFQRIGQVDAQPFAFFEVVTSFLELQAQVHVDDDVRRHQQFKTETARQQVILDVALGEALVIGKSLD